MKPPTVFLSYSHADEKWKDRLKDQLEVPQYEGRLDVWSDRDIAAGSDWLPEIQAAINRASVAVLLVSAKFLSSAFVRQVEVPEFLERRSQGGLQVVPVLVKPCLWKKVDWLARMQIRPGDDVELSGLSEHKADLALMKIADEIDNLLRGLVGLLPEPLSPADQDLVSDQLSQLPSFSDPERRKRVLESLPFGEPVADCEDPLLVAGELVRRCSGEARGFDALLDSLGQFEQYCALARLFDTLQQLFPQPVSWADVGRLKVVLDKVTLPDAEARALYRKVAPLSTPLDRWPRGGLFFSAIERLAKLGDSAPLFELLEQTRQYLPAATKAEVLAWAEKVSGPLNVDLSDIRTKALPAKRPAAAEGGKGTTTATLLIKFEPDLVKDAFLLTGWLREQDVPPLRLEAPGGPQKRERLEQAVAKIFAEARQNLHDRAAWLTVEALLPISLLGSELDRWRVSTGRRTKKPLGGHCSVLVRSYDRIYDPDYWETWPLWKQKWQERPKAPLTGAGEEPVFWACCAEDLGTNGDELYDCLEQAGSVLVALTLVAGARTAEENLERVLDAGMPIVLWLRPACGQQQHARRLLGEVVYDHALNELPNQLRDKRKQAHRERGDSPWGHVTLLWDDFDCLPPDFRFRRRAPEE